MNRFALAWAALLAGALVAAPVLGVEVEGNTLKFSTEEMAMCKAGGGCYVVTASRLNQMLAEERTQCRSSITGLSPKKGP